MKFSRGAGQNNLTKGDTIRILIAVLLAIALIWLVPQNTPAEQHINKARAEAKSSPVVKVKPKATEKAPKSEKKTAPATVAKAETPEPKPQPTTHDELMAAAGINPADYGAADYIISHESSWDVNATEPTSGAHGLPQALPYSKTGCGWDDAVCQLEWANRYAMSRYGGWWQAYAYWRVHRNW